MNTLRNLYSVLAPQERRQALLLVPLLGLSALVEVAGVASVMPFLALVADPAAIQENKILTWLYQEGGFSDTRTFLIATGVAMFCLVMGSNALTALSTWAVLRFSWMRNHSIALRLLRGYLAKPYSFFLNRHTSDLGKNLVAEVQQVVAGALVPAMQTAAKGVGGLAVLGLLIVIDPVLALLISFVLGGAYGLIFVVIRRSQRLMGRDRLSANKDRFEILAEAFGGIKEIKLLGRERNVVRRFAKPSLTFASTTASNAVVRQIPRFALEAIAFGGILLMVLYLLGTGQAFKAILPTLGLYAFAGYRLMPSLQAIFNGLTSIRFSAAALEQLLADLPSLGIELPAPSEAARLELTDAVRLRDVTFRYPTAQDPLFQGLNLEIPAGKSVAFVGETGSGKSTLADLILGLLEPTGGGIEIDGQPLTADTVRAWQANVGYVPQTIFLANDTVARNIAFGLPDEEIDVEAVELAARAACIESFVRYELPQGYGTVVGERGIRLSGGQRQRIGIARALYHEPQVIVFDEATSSLDGLTEESVLQAVVELAKDRTIIMIAHRLSTVRFCDHILLLSGGEVIDGGRYDELMSSSLSFRALAEAGGRR